MNIEHISVSRSGTWDQCHQLYKYKYHLRIPSPEESPEYFAYGKIIHKIIELHTLNRGTIEIGKLAQDVLTGVVDLEHGKKAPPLSLEYKRKLPEHLRHYMKLAARIGTEGLTEWQFNYDLSPPNNYNILGFIDRLIIKDSGYFIVDYKTTKKGGFRKNRQTIVDDLQLQMYCRVVQKHFNVEAKKIQAALYYVDGGDLVGATFSDKTLEQAEQHMLNAYIQIKDSNPDLVQGNVGRHCKRCDYRKVCPFYKLTD